MRPQLKALAARQGGVITRTQALAAGHTEREIRQYTRSNGPWMVIRRGAYCEREVWESADEYDGRLLLRDRAAHLQMVHPHLMSHDSAARLHGLPLLRPPVDLVHVTRFGVGGSRTEGGVKHHLTRLGLLTAGEVAGIRCTGLARTGLDVAREHGFPAGVVTTDAVLRRGVTLADFEAELALMWCWPGVTQSRAAAELCDPGAETPGESLMRLLLHELALGTVHTQFPVHAGRRLTFVDAVIGPRAFEFDGFKKFTRGVTDRDPSETAWDEKTRQDALNQEGFGVSRVIWSELFGKARVATGERLAREYAQSVRLFGEAIPEKHRRFAESEEGQRLRAERLREKK